MSPRVWNTYRRALVGLTLPAVVRSLAGAARAGGHDLSAASVARLVARIVANSRRIETASGFLEHLTIGSAVLRVPRSVEGAVVECGAYRGGSTANLSLLCEVAGRQLHVYDSFEGLPEPAPEDERHWLPGADTVHTYERGMYTGSLAEVRSNVTRFGAVDRCVFHPGFFEETLQELEFPCVAAFVDVDLRDSVKTCVRAIWPRLVDGGALFVHEAHHEEIASLFFERDWWLGELDTEPPGLVGAGSGLGLDLVGGYWGSPLAFALKNPARERATVRRG